MAAALSCDEVAKTLGDKSVLAAVTLEVARGEVVTLLGASGSGKTTLLRLVAGLMAPDRGRIAIDDRLVASTRTFVPPELRRVGMVFQDYALWPHMTVNGNLGFGMKSQGLKAAEIKIRLDHALEVTQLGAFAGRYPNELSGGQQQRVAIARCLAARPSLMLLDEPLSNLDASLREDLRTEMMQLVRREGITVVYVTHDQAEAMAVSDRIAVLRAGRLVQFDTPQRLYEAPANAFVATFIGGSSLLPGVGNERGFEVDGLNGTILNTCNRVLGETHLMVRPEDARPVHAFPVNRLVGRVHTSAFQGRCWRLSVAVGKHKLRLDWSEGPAEGSEIAFSLPPERCVLVAN